MADGGCSQHVSSIQTAGRANDNSVQEKGGHQKLGTYFGNLLQETTSGGSFSNKSTLEVPEGPEQKLDLREVQEGVIRRIRIRYLLLGS